MTEAQLFDALGAKYTDKGAYVVLPQVARGTGYNASRWLDAVVMSLWPSRGLWMHGCEIKCARGDWLRELKQPAKADDLWHHLDYFSVVTSTPDLIKPGELPPTWGHMAWDPKKSTLVDVVKAPFLQTDLTRPFSRAFFASIVRRLAEVRGDVIAQQVRDAEARGRKHAADDLRCRMDGKDVDALHLSHFLEAAGHRGLGSVDQARRLGAIAGKLATMTGAKWSNLSTLEGHARQLLADVRVIRESLTADLDTPTDSQ